MNPDHVFARKTRQHSIALQNSPPCAKELYDWLLRQAPAGKPADIYLEDFQAEQSGRLHGKGYQLRWIKDCLKHLIELDLVEVAYKISSKVFKLITWHPQQRNAENQQSSAQNLQPNARSHPSNADSLVPIYREIKETTDNPTHHPVSTDEQERVIDDPTPSKTPEPEIEPQDEQKQVIQQIEAAGFNLNSTLITIVRSTQAQIVLQAIEAAQQYLHTLQARNKPLKRQPEAVLVKAIREQWSVNNYNSNTPNLLPPDFNEWFDRAREVGLVLSSSSKADWTGHQPGVLCVRTVSGDWEPYDQMRRLHPLDEVRELAKRKQAETLYTPSSRRLQSQRMLTLQTNG